MAVYKIKEVLTKKISRKVKGSLEIKMKVYEESDPDNVYETTKTFTKVEWSNVYATREYEEW